jgi:hypothetical protein
MVHFMRNLDTATPAVVMSGFSSQSPGAQLVPFSAFRMEPLLPEEVVKETFRITGQHVQCRGSKGTSVDHSEEKNIDSLLASIWRMFDLTIHDLMTILLV